MNKLLLIFYFLISSIIVNAQFGSQQLIAGQTDEASSVYSADLDGDGDMDILSSSEGDNKIAWYENLGGGVFNPQQKIITTNASGARHVHASDLDGDGDFDVLSASKDGNNIAWYENLGNGTFGIQQVISTMNNAEHVYTEDLDGDGDMDVLYAAGTSVGWIENLGGGLFSSANNVTSITQVELATSVYANDLDGDGDMDILATFREPVGFPFYQDIVWCENLGGGNFGTAQTISTIASQANSVFTSDLDGDGDQDVLSASTKDHKLAWYENLGGGSFGVQQVIATVGYATCVYTTDIDGDGDDDILLANRGSVSTISWFENLGGGIFSSQNVIIIGPVNAYGFDYVYAEDIDGDGDMDALSASPVDGTIAWYENLGGGAFGVRQPLTSSAANATSVYTSDLDGDGDMDVLSASAYDNELAWYENLGQGKFGPQQEIDDSLDNPISVRAADVDGDGDNDILSASSGDDKIAWYENLGGGNFGSEQIISNIANAATSIHFSDLNGDGDIDVLSASQFDDKIAWYENLGGGAFSLEKVITASADGASFVYAKDLDNDGDEDVLSASGLDDKIAWYENLGGGIFGMQQIITTQADGANCVYSIDIDGDGDNDVLSSSGTDDKIAWYENLGGGNFGPQQIISTLGYSPSYIHANDMDGDGDSDVLSAYGWSFGWYENLGGGTFANLKGISNNIGASSSVHSVDLDGDGDIDVLSSSIQDGKIAWHENNSFSANQVTGQLYLDLNQNGNKDTSEVGVQQFSMQATPQSSYSDVYSSGKYIMNFADSSGNHQIYPLVQQYWKISSDSLIYNVTIDSASFFRDSLDFGFYPDTLVDSLNIELTGSFPRCGSIVNYWIDYHNVGTTIPSGIIHLQLDSSINYVGANLIPDSINGQNIYWHYDSLFYFTNEQINLYIQMPGFMSLGNTLTSYLNVGVLDSLGNGSIVYTSSDTLAQILLCAYDPNDKIASPVGIDSLGYISPNTQKMEYTIRFQNTGNDTAQTVIIKDQLDVNLDWQTLTPLVSSHNMLVNIDQNGEVTFQFYNIMLPDSGVDYIGSQGFVKYTIDLNPNLVSGTSILNTAQIFFDQNPAVITNTKINTIYDCSGPIQNTISNLSVCENDTIFGNTTDLSTTIFTWAIPSVYNSSGPNFNWLADTSGTFNLTLSAINNICIKDTTISITVLTAVPVANNNQVICFGDSLLIYGSYQNVSGIYYDSLQTVNGCDSILSTTLAINPVFLANQNESICFGDSLLIYGTYQNVSGIYYDSLQTVNGCDSILSRTLAINPVFLANQNESICFGDSLLIYGTYQNVSGIYYDSLQTVNGCDSILSTTLAITPVYSANQNDSICFGDSILIYGTFQNILGIYYDSLQTINGCDSILSTTLIVNQLPNVTITSFSPDTLCDNGVTVALPVGSPTGGIYSGTGVGGGNFDPVVVGVGTHDVIYTYTDINSCVNSDTSIVTVKLCVGIDEVENDFGILIYPNPNTGLFTIEKPSDLNKTVKVSVLDAASKLIINKVIPISKQKVEININKYSNGIYYLQLIVDEEIFVKQILKQ